MVFYKPLSSHEVFAHPRLTVVEDQIELPNGQQGDYLWFADGRDAVTIIARNADAQLLVQQEYSYLPGKALYQFVGGGVENGETLQAAAKRELAEETQSQAECLTLIGSYLMDHRRSRSQMHVFMGENLSPCQSVTQDKYEADLQHFWMSEIEVETLITEGKIINATMLAAWAIYKNSQLC